MGTVVYTIQPIEFWIVFGFAVLLMIGICFFTIRRRNEILQEFLTPEEPDIEEHFFKKRSPVMVEEESVSPQETGTETIEEVSSVWGDEMHHTEPEPPGP